MGIRGGKAQIQHIKGGERREREREMERKKRGGKKESDNKSRITTVPNTHLRWTSLSSHYGQVLMSCNPITLSHA